MKLHILDQLSTEEREQLYSRSLKKTYQRKKRIFDTGEYPQYLYILLEGQICICDDSKDGSRSIMTIIQEPMDCFGEVYLFMDMAYPFYAETMKKSSILMIPKAILPDYPQVSHTMNILLSNKAYTLSQKLKLLMKDNLQEKILEYVKQHPAVVLKRHEMASYLGVSRPALSKELYKMIDEGLLRMDENGNFITVI